VSTAVHEGQGALRACWHPVAYAADVTDRPHPTTLLGEPLVLWRDRTGTLRAFRDVCIHRGTALSLGRIDGDDLVCAYHGWRYRGDGACVAIPQLADPTRVPARARAVVHAAQERHGIVWVALETPSWPVPDVPELADSRWRTVRTGPFAWACDASRQVENFTDFGHFAFVHPGLLGEPERAVVAPHVVSLDGHVVRYAYGRPDVPSTETFPVFDAEERKDSTRRTRYALHLPYTIVEHIAVAIAYRRAMRAHGLG
jgi:vanillate O-demethylase monooxygenase subunit